MDSTFIGFDLAFNGHVLGNTSYVGIGFVIRDHYGTMLRAFSKST